MLVLCVSVCAADQSSAEWLTVHEVYGSTQTYYPVYSGETLPAEEIGRLEAMGTWHLENGTPWDPHAIITENITVYLDEQPDPPEPDPPAPDPPAPPSPEPTPKNKDDGSTDLLVAVVGIGAMVAAVGILVLVGRKK